MGKRFLFECESKIKQMSINTKNLIQKGNSSNLVRKFNRVRKTKNPLLIFTTTITVLEELQNLDLIWNTDIPNELARRKEIAEIGKQEKENLHHESPYITRRTQAVDLFDRRTILDQLEQYISVKDSIAGALDRVQTNDPDSSRQCITSCRAAIESLCMEVGKNADWKQALNAIFPSDTDRKQIKCVWDYLSNKGAHGGHNPTKKEAEYCLQWTIMTLNFIINGRKT